MSQAKEAAKEIAVVSQRLNFQKCVDDYEAIISKHYSPLVIAADQLAQAAEASRLLIIKMRDLLIISKIVELDPESKSNTVTWLDTALSNYKRVREG
jgi:hypothetical protein